jgi:hypothetical protein
VAAALLLVGTVGGMSLLLNTKSSDQEISKSTQDRVQNVLDLDAHYFKDIRAKQQLWDPTEEPAEIRDLVRLGKTYQAKIAAIDLAECPKAFRSAFQSHASNWEDVIKELEAASASQTAPTYDSRQELQGKVQEITKPLDKTWKAVGTEAKKYDVFVSK